jgi:outer membrane protein assembly factor BamB
MLRDVIADPQPAAMPNRPRRRAWVWLAVILGGLLAGVAAAIIVLHSKGSAAATRTRPPPHAVVLGSAAGTKGLDVLPFPGTPDASPLSQIAFPALLPAQIRSVTVRGSRSGFHGGRLEALPGGRGTAFVPQRRFSAGEHVSVQARILVRVRVAVREHRSSRAVRRASWRLEQKTLQFSFTVATPEIVVPGKPASAASVHADVRPLSFHSAPGLHPPPVNFSGHPGPGYVFLTAQDSTQQGPMILDGQGHLVWFRRVGHKNFSALSLSVQRYRGKPVLTWWQGRVTSGGYGIEGEDVILNQHYQTVAVLHGGEGYSTDLHEITLTPQGTALVTAFVPVKANLTSVGGPVDGTVLDGVVQEIDIKTGRVVWEWHALGHVPLSASEEGQPIPGAAYDYFHINAVQQLPDGNLLVSARNTWAVYEISRTTGKVIWTLGGKHSDFHMGPQTNFEWQHDALLEPDGTLTVFDDGSTPAVESQSRALALNVDTNAMRVTLKHAYTHTPSLLASAMGSTQLLHNGNVFVGWGTQPNFSEYTPGGRQIFDGSFHAPVQSYRAHLEFWSGQPATPPGVSASPNGRSAVTVYASWNGATDVTGWRLLAGTGPDHLAFVKTVVRSGFETAIQARTSDRFFEVQALAGSGKVLGTSEVVSR